MPTPHQPAQPETAPVTAHTPTAESMRAALAIETNHVWGRQELQRQNERAQIIDRETGLPMLISERDRLRRALIRIASFRREAAQHQFGNADAAEGWPEVMEAREALAETTKSTTPSESARLREINAELMTALNDVSDSLNVFLNGISGEELRQPVFRRANSAADKAAIALKNAKDAQG